MTDQNYSSDFYIDSGIIKSDVSMDSLLQTASVPIPARRGMDLSDIRDFGMEESDKSPNSNVFQDDGISNPSIYSGNTLWGTKIAGPDIDIVKMEDDDIFQVDKSDLIQGPTLAELNANDETLGLNDLDDLSFDELLLPDENSYIQVPQQSITAPRISPSLQVVDTMSTLTSQICASFPPDGIGFYKDSFSSSVPSNPFSPVQGSPTSQNSSNSSLQVPSVNSSITPPPNVVSPLQHRHSTLHELLLKKETSHSPLGQSVPGPSFTGGAVIRNLRYSQSRLSSSAPTHLGLEQIWQRREPRPHLLSTSSLAEGGSTSSLSTGKHTIFQYKNRNNFSPSST